METRGRQPRSGSRGDNIGRRLRIGAVGTIAVGGAIFVGGAASLVTAFANTGTVTASETCTTWSAAVSLNNNVTIDKIVDVVVTPSSLTAGLTGLSIDTTKNPGPVQIWSASGAAPATGTFTLHIYNSVDNAGKVRVLPAVFTTSADIEPASDCTTTPAIATTPVGTPGLVGTSISDVATVTGSGSSPTGTVIFKLFAPSNPNCNSDGTAPVFTSSPVTLVATAPHVSTATGPSYTTTATGTYHWVAAYSGDGGETYNPVRSNCADEGVVISNAAPTIATSQSAGGNLGVALSDTATVSGGFSPTGTVTFTLFPPSSPTCSGSPVYTSPAETLSGGKANSGSYTTGAAGGSGTYRWIATYSGDADNSSVASGCTAEAVIVTGGEGVQGITTTPGGVLGIGAATPSTGAASILNSMTIGVFLLLGGLGSLLVSLMLPRRRRI